MSIELHTHHLDRNSRLSIGRNEILSGIDLNSNSLHAGKINHTGVGSMVVANGPSRPNLPILLDFANYVLPMAGQQTIHYPGVNSSPAKIRKTSFGPSESN